MLFRSGSASGPFICGLIADRYGLLSTFYFMAATIVLANMFVFFIPDMGKPDGGKVAAKPATA